jgi:hypothetical protein
MRTVIIKGSIFRAMLAANRRCVVLHDIQAHPKFDEVIARVDNECLPELVQWFCEPLPQDDSQPCPAGTLMFYSETRDFGANPDVQALDAHVINVIHNEVQDVTFAVTPRRG